MSYNILAQALIKRELFPHSGNILKWVGILNGLYWPNQNVKITSENSQDDAVDGTEGI